MALGEPLPVEHPSATAAIDRRIALTLPRRVGAADLSQAYVVVPHMPEVHKESLEKRAISSEQTVFHELEAKLPILEGLIGESLLETAEALAFLDPIEKGTPKKHPSMTERVNLIDNAATDSMMRTAEKFPFQVDAHGEGFWDIVENNQDIRLMNGEFGSGTEKLTLWTDAIDNTEAASWGTPRAISAAVLAPENGLVEMSGRHFQKLVIPDTVEGIDVSNEPDDVFAAVLKDAGFESFDDRKKLIVIMLDRDANAQIEAAAKRAGATIVKWNGGDVLPLVTAGKQDDGTVRIMYTRGGGPELTIAGGLVTAINNSKREGKSGLSLSARVWDEDPDVMARNEVVTQRDIAPGGEAIAVIGFLTDDASGIEGTGIQGLPVYKKQPIPPDQKVNLLRFSRSGIEQSTYQRAA